MKRLLLASTAFLAIVTCPAPARADPVSLTTSALFALGVGKASFAVATFLVTTAGQFAITAALTAASKIFGPKQKQQARQASVVQLSLGETPPVVIYGSAVTGGSLIDAFNFGGTNSTDWEVLVINLADHVVESLEGYYVGDDYYEFSGNGLQSGFSNCLDIEFVNASRTVPPSRFATVSAGRWTSADVLAGRTRVWVAYKADEKVWSAGRPAFRWKLKGRKCIDPRDPEAGRVWTENASVCRYDYQRGIFAEDRDDEPAQLLIGRGLSAEEALADLVIPGANICDEEVDIDGGTEPRYRVGGVIQADESFDAVEGYFAAAMAGIIVQREGGVLVEPGAAKAPVFAITDDDLISAEQFTFSEFLPEPDRVNTIIPRYIEPSQGWKDHGAPIKRDLDDIAADGGPLEQTLSMSLVTSGTQAQRNGEIARRLGRLERRASLTLGPRFAYVEDGDWGTFTSTRHTGGVPMTVRAEAYSLDEGWKNSLALREITSAAFGEVAAVAPGAETDTPMTPPPTARPARITSRTVDYPLSSTASTIDVEAHDVTLDAYPWFLSLPAETISSLDDDTPYAVFWRDLTGDYEAYPTPASAQQTDVGLLLVGGWRTELSAGGYTPAPPPPPGYVGGSGTQIP